MRLEASPRLRRARIRGLPIELVIYPGAYHGFYYVHLQPGTTLFDHWLEYNGAAADDATCRLHQFLDRHLN